LTEGPGALPLLGPKAGGTFLRLGPWFYYLEYFSALLFGPSVVGQIFFIPLLGALLPLLLFGLLRRVVPLSISLLGAAWIGVSLFALLYSRFGWNPNLVPFFTLAGFLTLLLAGDETREKQSRYLIGAAFFLTLATQMHFLAFLAIPTITFLFLCYKRPRFAWQTWVGAFGVVLFLYVPMLLNESKTHFANTNEFFGAITEKSTKEDHSIFEKLIKNTEEYGLAQVVILSGYEGATNPRIEMSGLRVTSLVCDEKCDRGKWYGLAGLIWTLLSFVVLVVLAWREKEKIQKDTFVLLLLWQTVSFGLFLPLAYGIAPRFYLLTLPLFFINAVLVLWYGSSPLKGFLRGGGVALVVMAFLGSNLYFVGHRFDELRRSEKENFSVAPDRILKERTRVTYGQEQSIVTAILALPHAREYPLYFESTSQFKRAFKYHLRKNTTPTDGIPGEGAYREGVYVYVIRTRPTVEEVQKTLGILNEKYDIISVQKFGTLSLVVLTPKESFVIGDRQPIVPPIPTTYNPQAPRRYTWDEFLTGGFGEVIEAEPDTLTDEAQ
jgi:MFS family permease